MQAAPRGGCRCEFLQPGLTKPYSQPHDAELVESQFRGL
jgi:hypothetical protein